jgi:hypothetical protein
MMLLKFFLVAGLFFCLGILAFTTAKINQRGRVVAAAGIATVK